MIHFHPRNTNIESSEGVENQCLSPRYLIDDTEYMDRIYVYIRAFLFEFITPFIARLLLYYVVKE